MIFDPKQEVRTTVGEQLKTPYGRLILSRLQAGRVKTENGSAPYRLSEEELEKLKDEVIYYQVEESGIWARFEKPTKDIRAILGLDPLSGVDPFDLF